MGKSSAPAAPDLSGLIAASEQAAQLNYQMAQDQLAWAKEQYAQDSVITQQVVDSFLEATDFAQKQAEETQQRWEDVYKPVEDQMVKQAEQFATPEYKQQEMGRAAATTAQQVNQAVQTSKRGLESYGVNPSAPKDYATDIATRTGGAAASAGAANQAAEAVDAKSLALTSDVANMGRGYPATSAAYLNVANQAGQGASQATTSATQTASSAMTQPVNYMNAGTNALNVWGDTVNQGYANEIAAYNAQNQANSVWGQALGSLAGIASSFIPTTSTVKYVMQEGGAVPASASPSRGAVPDDVPILAQAGEFMIPKRAVEWFGQKFFHDQIAKADKQKAEATGAAQAQGQQAAVPAGSPAPAGPTPRTPQSTPAANPAGNKPVDTSAFDFARWGQNYLQQPRPMQASAQAGGTGGRSTNGSPPVIGPSRMAQMAPQDPRVPMARPAPPNFVPPMMAAGGAVSHYLPPPRMPLRSPARPMAVRQSPTVRMPPVGPAPISPTAAPMVRSIRGMADGGTVAPRWVWDAGINKWVPSTEGEISASLDAPEASADLTYSPPITEAYAGYSDAPVPSALGQVPRYPIPQYSASMTSPLSSGIVAAQGPVAQRVPGMIPGQNAQPPPQGNTFVRPGYQPYMGAGPPPIDPSSVQPGYQPGNMAYAPPPPGIFPYSRTPPPYGVGLPDYMGAPPPYGIGLSEPAVAASRSSSSAGRRRKSAGSGGGSEARKPRPRPDSKSTKKQPITREHYPQDMSAFEFARQGQDYLRGKPYRPTPTMPSARSK